MSEMTILWLAFHDFKLPNCGSDCVFDKCFSKCFRNCFRIMVQVLFLVYYYGCAYQYIQIIHLGTLEGT